MSVLHNVSNIYVDFENVIANTDIFVCTKLYKNLKDKKEIIKSHPIHGLFDVINTTGIESISTLEQLKTTFNPLRELADETKLSSEQNLTKSQQLDLICDDIYDQILSYNYTDIESIEDMTYTNIADSLVVLTKDKKLENIYVYVKNLSTFIHSSIYEHFREVGKVKIITGDRRKFFDEVVCDTYIFNNIMDIELLPSVTSDYKRKKIEIAMLNTIPNKQLWDTYFKDADNSHSTVSERFNASISIISKK